MSQKRMRSKSINLVPRTKESAADVRSNVVARGRILVADPNYPSRQEVKAIAALLVNHWVGEDEAKSDFSPEESGSPRDHHGRPAAKKTLPSSLAAR